MLTTMVGCAVAALGLGLAAEANVAAGMVQTVWGPVDPRGLGWALTHEHVLVDFIGADKVSPDRYDADEVVATMLPYLQDLRAAGVGLLFDCTPDYLGRDPVLLRRLSAASGVSIVTNTGWYQDPYLPAWAQAATAEEIAARWTAEALQGIGPERIKPGFIKIAANEGELSPTQRKIATAAALTALATGLTIASHTTQGKVARQQLEIIEGLGLPASRFVMVHADAEPDLQLHAQIARRGAWLSYDGIREGNAALRLPLVKAALSRWPNQLLISQDAGWYHVGEPRGGEVAALDWLPRAFVPRLRAAGVSERLLQQLLVENPARAFGLQLRGN
jgi:phosphotriesterase-related protein